MQETIKDAGGVCDATDQGAERPEDARHDTRQKDGRQRQVHDADALHQALVDQYSHERGQVQSDPDAPVCDLLNG